MGSHALGNVLSVSFPPGPVWEVRTAGRAGAHGECSGERDLYLRSKGVYWGFLTTPIFSSRVHEVSGVPEVPLGSLELRLVVLAGLSAIYPLTRLPTNSSDLRKARKHLL